MGKIQQVAKLLAILQSPSQKESRERWLPGPPPSAGDSFCGLSALILELYPDVTLAQVDEILGHLHPLFTMLGECRLTWQTKLGQIIKESKKEITDLVAKPTKKG